MQFHEKLKQLRTERGLTQKELAEKLNVSRSAVAKWENGLGLPSEESLDDLVAFFGVSRGSLISDRATEDVIVTKNTLLSAQKRWLIIVISIAAALLAVASALLGVFLAKKPNDGPAGGNSYEYGDHVHEYTEEQVVYEATCTGNGLIEHRCACGKVKIERTPPLGHAYGQWDVTQEPTCETEGVRVRYCIHNPNHSQTESVKALGHIWDEWTTSVPAKCTDPGIQTRICARTEMGLHSESRIVSPIGHRFGDWVTVRDPSCIYTGIDEQTCKECGYVESRFPAPIGHIYADGTCLNCGRLDPTLDLSYADRYNGDYGFRALVNERNGAAMQALYALIDDDARVYHIGAQNGEILGEYDYTELGLAEQEAVAVWKVYLDDHPLYYWMSKKTTAANGKIVLYVDKAYTDPDVRSALNHRIYATVESWQKEAESGESSYLTALFYHDKMISVIDISLDTDWSGNIVGVFEGRGAGSEGYARAFQLLLNASGIPNVFVSGMARRENESAMSSHAWNLARLDDGEWYWFDLYYDDVPRWMWGVRYNYFAVTDAQDVAWMDGHTTSEKPFSDTHICDSGTGVHYMPSLPAGATTPYAGAGELLLRDTFTVGYFTYAVVGFHTVQLVRCTMGGDVSVPESVVYGGVEYEVISVGSIYEDGKFSGMAGDDVFEKPIGTLFYPATIRFLFEMGCIVFDTTVEAYAVAEDNAYFTAVDGVLFTKSMHTLVAYPRASQRTEYTVPEGVVCIAFQAFRAAPALRSLRIGSTVRYAGTRNSGFGWPADEHTGGDLRGFGNEWAGILRRLENLENIEVDAKNPTYCARGDVLLTKDGTLLYGAVLTVEEIRIPASVEVIADSAFWSHNRVKRYVFEGTALRLIEDSAFANCINYQIVWPGTRAEWDAVEKEDGGALYEGHYLLTCLGDEG